MTRMAHHLMRLAMLCSMALLPSLAAAELLPGPFAVSSQLVGDIPVSADIVFETGTDWSGEEYERPPSGQNLAVVYYPTVGGAVAEGPFPLIVYGHGMRARADTCPEAPELPLEHFPADNAQDYQKMSEVLGHLASWGFIVASVDLSWLTPAGPPSGIEDRKFALRDAVNYMVGENLREGSPFRNKIRTMRVGLMGHSMGADAAVSLGASGLLEDRVGAIAAIAPPNHAHSGDNYHIEDFAPKPIILFQGTRDFWFTSAPGHPTAESLYRAADPMKHLVTITNANHFGYTDDICDIGDGYLDQYSGLNGVLARGDQQDAAKAYLAAFFRRHLQSECVPELQDYLDGTLQFAELEGLTIDVLAETGGAPACDPPPPPPDRFESPLNNDSISNATPLAMEETHSLDQRIMVDGERCRVFETNVSWEAQAPNVNLHDSLDRDFFQIDHLPDLATYSGGDIDPSPRTIQPLIEQGTLERQSEFLIGGERGTDLLLLSGRLDLQGVDTVRYGDVTTNLLHFENPQSELSMTDEPITLSYGEDEHDVVPDYDVWAEYRIDVLRVPQPSQLILDLALARELAAMPCPGGFFPGCKNLSFRQEFETAHPYMKPFRNCFADGCPDYFLFLWKGSPVFDVKFATMPAVSFKLFDIDQKLIAEAVQVSQLPIDGQWNFTATSFASEQPVLKRLYASNLSAGFYLLVVSGPAASYTVSFDPPPPAPDSDGDGIVDPFDPCPNDPEDADGVFDADGCPDLAVAVCRDVTVEAGSSCAAYASIDDGSHDEGGDSIALTQSPAGPYPVGHSVVTLTATDSRGATSQCKGTVTVLDKTSPTMTAASANPSVLWPPNHKMVDVTVKYGVTDNCDQTVCKISSVTSNESIGSSDYTIVDAHHVRLLAERNGKGAGRVYVIAISCNDASGNSSNLGVTATVPHDEKSLGGRRKPAMVEHRKTGHTRPWRSER